MRNCFIPFCDNFCKNYSRRMMFMAPKENDLFLKWKEVLPTFKREFRKLDRICERHFHKDDIITTWDHVINGAVHSLERKKPMLKPYVVPSLNLGIDDTLVQTKLRKKARNALVRVEIKTKESDESKPEEQIIVVEPEETLMEITEITEAQNLQIIEETNLENQYSLKFEVLFDDVFEITLPSTIWGIHRDAERKTIVFSCFDMVLRCPSKLYIITDDLIAKTYVYDKLVSELQLMTVETDDLSDTLQEIDNFRVCVNIKQNEDCKCILEKDEEDKCKICGEISTDNVSQTC